MSEWCIFCVLSRQTAVKALKLAEKQFCSGVAIRSRWSALRIFRGSMSTQT
jgi:hypothetical protein